MKEKLIKLLDNSYSPYSKFRVSAIVVTKDGKEFNGVNVENASYGSTICAERCALFNTISNGYKKEDIEQLYLMCDNEKLSMPCFSCRQVISELMPDNSKIFVMNHSGKCQEFTVKELCPYPFNGDDLK